jgi:hypothetical protein
MRCFGFFGSYKIPILFLKGTAHYSHGVERTLDKLSSKGQGRSPLKYTNCKLHISLERNFFRSSRVWVSKNIEDKFSSTGQSLGAKPPKKCYHVGILEAVVHWPLASSVKAKRTNFCSPPIKLLQSFVRSTDNHSVKCP